MIHTPLRALRPRRGQLLAAAAVSMALFLGACSGTGAPGGPTESATSAPSTSSAATPPSAATGPAGTASAGTPAPNESGSTATPSAVTAVKELVAGFPAKVIPLPKGAQVQSSGLEHGTPLSSASLTATTSSTPKEILDYYTKVFTEQDFKAQPGDSVDGVPLKTFVRAAGQEVITVSVVVTASTSTFTVGASLLPASFK